MQYDRTSIGSSHIVQYPGFHSGWLSRLQSIMTLSDFKGRCSLSQPSWWMSVIPSTWYQVCLYTVSNFKPWVYKMYETCLLPRTWTPFGSVVCTSDPGATRYIAVKKGNNYRKPCVYGRLASQGFEHVSVRGLTRDIHDGCFFGLSMLVWSLDSWS